MDVLDAIRARKSIRGYKPDLVPKEVLREILKVAIHSPSGLNTQPWELTVITGEVLDNIRRGNVEMLNSGAIPMPDAMQSLDTKFETRVSFLYKGKYKQRQVELAIQLFELMGIAREDKEKRAEWMQRGFRFFDAPAAIILSVDRSVEELKAMIDIGSFAQTVCLTALNYGLGTCIEDQGVMFPEVVRKFTGIPESKRIVISIAIGYPDRDFPANKLETEREPVENIVTWCGFD